MQNRDEGFRTLDITNPVAENHLQGEASRFDEDIEESLHSGMVVRLLDTARKEGKLVNGVFLGFFQIDQQVSLALVQLFNDEQRVWKRLAVQRCPGRVLEACISLVASRKSLECLCLYQNNLGYTGISGVAMVLASNPNELKTLDLEDYISPNSAEALSAGIRANTTLHTLDLHGCHFDRDALECIAKGVAHHPGLQHLQLSKCLLTDQNAALFVSLLVNHQSVRRIDFDYNHCCVKSMKALASAIRSNRMPKVSILSLVHQCTRLDPRLTIPLPVGIQGGALESNSLLKELILSNNYLHPPELDLFMSGTKLSRFEWLDMSRCGISDDGIQVVLSNLPDTIKRLNLAENMFVSEESEFALLESIQFHARMEMLDVDRDLECWQKLCHQARLNRGGKRVISSSVGRAVWKLVLKRVNRIDWSEYDPIGPGVGFQEDVIFDILKGPALCAR